MPNTQLSRWISIISHCSRRGSHEETLRHFCQMQVEGFPPNRFVLPSIFRSASMFSDSRTGRSLHGFVIRTLLVSDPFISSALIDFYSKRGRIDNARDVFDATPERDLVVWNTMISCYASYGLLDEGMSLLRKMQSCGPEPDLFTWNALVYGFAQSGDEQMALTFFDSMRTAGIVPDVFSWTSLISGSVNNFHYKAAFTLFRQMVAVARVRPSSATISSILPASANTMDFNRGREVHGYAVVSGVERDLFVSSSLVDMYAKCGFVSDAEKVFDSMPEKSTVSWNSMIFAYSNHGPCGKAIQLFHQMEMSGLKPDHLTFTALLTACSHAGMVQLGNELLTVMQECYGIAPRLEHYACMVDLLGRAGKLSEACDLISGMPIKPDSFVWGALLGACRVHNNVELAQIAARRLCELEPECTGSFSLLSTVMVSTGRLGDAAKIKQLMKQRKFRRYTGCSWTQASHFID